MYAISRAGRDKGNIYIIISETAEYLYVADGKSRTADKPKRKNKKHIQIINKKAGAELIGRLREKRPVYNEEIRYLIKVSFGRSKAL